MDYPKPKRIKPNKIVKPKVTICTDINPRLRLIKDYLKSNCSDSLEIKLNHLPPSANKLYEKTIRKNFKTGKHFLNVNTHDDVEIFRGRFIKALREMKITEIQPKQLISVVIELYSDTWLNQDKTPKKRDSDNMIKSLMDSLEIGTRYPDEMAYEHHLFKLHGKEQTILTIYAIPNIIH